MPTQGHVSTGLLTPQRPRPASMSQGAWQAGPLFFQEKADMSVRLGQIVEAMREHGGVLHGDAARMIVRLAPIDSATPDSITFLSDPKLSAALETTEAGCVIVAPAMEAHALEKGLCCLVVPQPYVWWAYLSQWWRATHHPAPEYHIHPSAVVEEGAEVDPTAIIGPLCVVERGARIGAYTWLKSRVTVSAGCRIGAHCILHPGVVIGADGFGFAHEKGDWIKIEQLGAVRIGDHVEIGANTCIDRGAIEDTVIGDGVKLDNLIMIAHNVQVGERTAMAACTGIAGSARIGAHCTIGGAVNIAGHLTIADGVHVSATSMVTHSLLKPGAYTGFFPIDDNATWEKNAATVRQLYKLRERIRSLERQLSTLTASK